MKFLIIDSSNTPAFVRLYEEKKLLGEARWLADGALGVNLIAAIDGLLADNGSKKEDINRIAVFRGPGTRSSIVRVGVVVASVMSRAVGAELVSVDGTDKEVMVEQALGNAVVSRVEVVYTGKGYGHSDRK